MTLTSWSLFRVRVNTLQLNWRRNFNDGEMDDEQYGTRLDITLNIL